MIYFDTETCGLHGPIVLIQWAENEGPVQLHCPWTEQIDDTLNLINQFCNNTIVAFNLAYDWFHICQLYTTLLELAKVTGLNAYPIDHIDLYASLEPIARDGPCLKPVSCFDVMLHARKGKYQSTMDRKDIIIKKVPSALAKPLATELEKRIPLKDIYFARRKKKGLPKWQIDYIKRPDGNYDPDFNNIVLRFAPSSALKALAVDALGIKDIMLYQDIEVDPKFRPVEIGWAPFALALSSKQRHWIAKTKDKSGYAWPGVIEQHISHWAYNVLARKYAEHDVIYTRDLYHYFNDPVPGDIDSSLAACVGAVRWRGFSFDETGIKQLRDEAIIKSQKAPKAPRKVFQYVSQAMSPVEKVILEESTKRVLLEEISKWENHPAAGRAQECLDARKAQKEIEIYDKLLQAGRFHASFKVIGTFSSRMSGSDGLNPQGIKHDRYVRQKFPLAFGGTGLCGGDFAGFEVAIAVAVYNDPELQKQLCTCSECGYVCTLEEYARVEPACPKCNKYTIKCSRCKTSSVGVLKQETRCLKCNSILPTEGREDTKKKIHGLFAQELFPGESYDDIVATKGSSDDHYDKGKRGIFSQLYGGNFQTMVNKLGVDEEVARKAEIGFSNRFRGVAAAREKIKESFCSMRQPGGIGKAVEWHEPAEYIETLLGFRRYFTLENQICRALFQLASKLPDSWRHIKIKCVRRDREQMVGGAAMSALYAAAFNIQSRMMRAAANHLIQSTGATITKGLQERIWQLQPPGINTWKVQPMNVHDEIMCPTDPELKSKVTDVVKTYVDNVRPVIPLIKIDWNENMKTWADK